MVIVSAKVSKRKLLMCLAAAAAVIALLVFLVLRSGEPSEAPDAPEQTLAGSTNEERAAFLRSFGWQVQETPSETQEVRIPEEFNEVFTRYNHLQQSQGFDLSRYAGKAAKRYVYTVTDSSGEVSRATVLTHKGKIIGGDVTSGDHGGMHSFALPQAVS